MSVGRRRGGEEGWVEKGSEEREGKEERWR